MPHKSKLIINESQEVYSINAGYKAPVDVQYFLSKEGFSTVCIGYMHRGRWYRPLLIPFYALKLAYYLRHCDIALFQHPYDTYHNALRLINSLAFALVGKRSARKFVLIHDIHTLRYHIDKTVQEIGVLNSYEGVIVHSPKMEAFLENYGCRVQMSVLGLFDYKVKTQYLGSRLYSSNVVFAGNLSKSGFLWQFKPGMMNVNLYLYGRKPEMEYSAPLFYKGSFLPDQISDIEGSWGLVWDGDSVERCEGELGEYLKYNSPHKASLYVCAHLPLIVPENSAVSRIVAESNIGITISSLLEMEEAIASVSNSQYEEMQNNIKKVAERLTSGGNVKEAISSLECCPFQI